MLNVLFEPAESQLRKLTDGGNPEGLGHFRTLVVRRLGSAVEWAADTLRGLELRVLSPGLRGVASSP